MPEPIPPLCWRHEQEARAAGLALEPVDGCEDCQAARGVSEHQAQWLPADVPVPKPDHLPGHVSKVADRLNRARDPQRLMDEATAALDQEKLRQRVRKIAADELYQEDHGYQPLATVTLADLLAQPDEDEVWRVDSILPAGALTVLAASAYSGKTTLALSLVRAMLRGESFLGFPAHRPDGRIFYVNTDRMPERLFRPWARSVIGPTPDVLWAAPDPVHLDVIDPANREAFVRDLQRNAVAFLVIDSALPLLSALGLDENSNSEVRKWLDSFRSLTDAGVEILILHHSGWSATGRARGASSWDDAPDVSWTLTRDPEDDSREFHVVKGRGGIVPTHLAVDMDEDTHRVYPAGEPLSKAEKTVTNLGPKLLGILTANGGSMASGALVKASGKDTRTVSRVLRALEATGQIIVSPDPNDKRTKVITATGRPPDLLRTLEAAS